MIGPYSLIMTKQAIKHSSFRGALLVHAVKKYVINTFGGHQRHKCDAVIALRVGLDCLAAYRNQEPVTMA